MSIAERALFLGSKKFGLEIFKSIYYTSKYLKWRVLCPQDLDDIRTYQDEFLNFCRKENLDLLVVTSVKMVTETVKDFEPDVMVVSGYYNILPKKLLDLVPLGVWGIHNSLLPKYRGGAALVWQIINGEKELGSSLFKFTTEMDAGEILHQVTINSDGKTTIKTATEQIQKLWIEQLPKKWRDLLNGEVELILQNDKDATYCAQRIEEDGEISWSKTAKFIDRFIRAQATPYPRAYFIFEGRKIKIVEHQIFFQKVYGTPGQVFLRHKESVVICCEQETAIKLVKVEIDGVVKNASEVLKTISVRL